MIHLPVSFFEETLDREKERGKIVSTREEEDVDAAFAVFTVLKSGKSSIFAVFEGQVSEKMDEHSFYPDHNDTVVHDWGGWEPHMKIHCPNPRSRSATDATPVSRNLAVLFRCAGGRWEDKGDESSKNQNPN
ncbi:hypothetical protein BTVI_105957 [Pitangus sulphuratus]|nr:hypothetical protein BTVI_105957 [Pitangus sulphuratus]